MKGLDTNILIRYLTQDDPILSPKANRIVEEQLSERNPGYVSLVVIAETAWVLHKKYAAQREEIADAIERILTIDSLLVQNEQQVYQAVIGVRAGEGTFADALICALHAAVGCSSTLTFDARSRLQAFEGV